METFVPLASCKLYCPSGSTQTCAKSRKADQVVELREIIYSTVISDTAPSTLISGLFLMSLAFSTCPYAEVLST